MKIEYIKLWLHRRFKLIAFDKERFHNAVEIEIFTLPLEKCFSGEWRHFYRPCASCRNCISRFASHTHIDVLFILYVNEHDFASSWLCEQLHVHVYLDCICWFLSRQWTVFIRWNIVLNRWKSNLKARPLEWAWTKEQQITKIPSAVFIRGNTRISCKEFAEDKQTRNWKCFLLFLYNFK